jgi:AraC-like DNA-binding protein
VVTTPRSHARAHRLAARLVAPILTAARADGLDVDDLLAAAGVDKDITRKRGTDDHVALAGYFRLWELALARSGTDDFALRAATALGLESFGVIGFACMTSANIAEAFSHLARYYGVLSTASRWRRVDEPPHVCLTFEIEPGPPVAMRAAIEHALGEIVHFAALMVGQRVPVLEVRLPHAAPRDQEPYRRHFRAPLAWGAPRATLVLDRAALEIPLLRADRNMLAYFAKQADALASQHASEEALSARVRRLVIEALPAGPPAPAPIARSLGLSARSLRRHLAGEGTSFQALVEETRLALAKQHLENPRLTVSEIAFLVGFSELSPFQRAFRRWTKLTPREYRARAADARVSR